MPRRVPKRVSKSPSEEIKLLRQILANQRRMLKEERTVEREERSVEQEEKEVLAKEESQLEEMKELESIEKDIRAEVKGSPLGRITVRDFTKSLIGAFFGTVGHFAFFYGTKLAHDISMVRASLLYLVSFLLAVLFMYFAGFRRVDRKSLAFLPVRVGIIYLTSIIVILFVLSVFGFLTGTTGFEEAFKTVSTISILAVLGAATADLIGREE